MNSELRRLIERVIDGDEDAHGEVIEHFLDNGEAEAIVRSFRPHRNADVDAIVDDTLLQMIKGLPGFTPPKDGGSFENAFFAWFRKIARHNVMDDAQFHNAQRRDASREIDSDDDFLSVITNDDDLTASQVVAADKLRRKVLLASDFLRKCEPEKDEDYFAPFELYLQGYTLNQIATELATTTGAAGNRIRTAKNVLRERWQELSAYVSDQS